MQHWLVFEQWQSNTRSIGIGIQRNSYRIAAGGRVIQSCLRKATTRLPAAAAAAPVADVEVVEMAQRVSSLCEGRY